MLQTLQAWLNGTREYYTGTAIYQVIGTDEKLKALFAQGHTLYSNYRLQEELRKLCEQMKRIEKVSKTVARVIVTGNEIIQSFKKHYSTTESAPPATQPAEATKILNPGLYSACREEAMRMYKESRNLRAVLFASLPENNMEDPNRADLVLARQPMVLEFLKLDKQASELFDRADYVKINGQLPDEQTEDDGIDQIPDHEVKLALDNARKAFNKLKGREQTSDRVALMQKHTAKIQKLEARWLSLKQKK